MVAGAASAHSREGHDADAIIVGAGIQGATLALQMARRGLRAIVVERHRPGAANTASSFGFLHGGLRYLQRLDLNRWLRSRREQTWFVHQPSQPTQTIRCVMPLYRGGARSPALFRAAFLAERIALRAAGLTGALPAGAVLTPEQMPAQLLSHYPLPTGIIGAAVWHEALLLDPCAAVDAMLGEAAREARTQVVCADAAELIVRSGVVAGVIAMQRGQRIEIRAPRVVLCAGAANRVLASQFDRDLPRLSSAMLAFNLLLDLPAPDGIAVAVSPQPGRGRSLFLRSAGGKLLAGTWYARCQAPTNDAVATVPPALIETALQQLRACLPTAPIAASRLLAVRAGRLPDADGSGRALREEDVLIDHQRHRGPRGLWSVLGTKLTTARALSERAVTGIWPNCDGIARDFDPAAAMTGVRNAGAER